VISPVVTRATPAPLPPSLDLDPAGAPALTSVEEAMLGGRVGVHLGGVDAHVAHATGRATLARIAAWAALLTRFDAGSDLSRLNDDPGADITVRPTLAAVLDWGRAAEALTGGIANIALLDERLAAELGGVVVRSPAETAARRWSLTRTARETIVHRPAGLRFDLDGVAKGWLADRALDGLRGHAVAVVDADGDIAIGLRHGETCAIGIADPRREATDLLVLRLASSGAAATRFGVATSGTSIHRWSHGDRPAHHLIDPRTGRSADTDLVQATVVARTARHAEAFAKTAVILGSGAALETLERADVEAAVLLTDDGRLLLTPGAARLVA
jgi:FAD:protein FMN transferase